MKRIEASLRPVDPGLKYRSPSPGDVSEVVSEAASIYVDGELSLVYLPQTEAEMSSLAWAFKTTKYAIGFRTEGLVSRSAVVGFSPRIALRRDFCSACYMSSNQPEQHTVFVRAAQKAARIFGDLHPERYKVQRQKLNEVSVEWQIPGTPFTSGIVNKDNELAYHHDAGNFRDCWSCMYASAERCDGGLLSVPELDLGFSFKQPALIMFDGARLLHGVTPLGRRSPLTHRYSCVFYALQGMKKCLTLDEELTRIRKIKTRRERARVNVVPPLFAQHQSGQVTAKPKLALLFGSDGQETAELYSTVYTEMVIVGAHVDIIRISNSKASAFRMNTPVPKLVDDQNQDKVEHLMFSSNAEHLERSLEELNRYDAVIVTTETAPAVTAGITKRVVKASDLLREEFDAGALLKSWGLQ